MEVIHLTHVLLVAEPYDWETNYTSYYTKSGDNYIPVTGVVVPSWQSGTYYAKQTYTNPDLHRFSDDVPDNQDLRFSIYGTDSYRYVGIDDYHILTTEEPDDWETNYTDYLYVEDYTVTTYQPVDWETNYTQYFEKSGDTYTPISGSTAPIWEPDTYYAYAKTYKYVIGISAPQWTANTYYKVSEDYTLTMVKPSDWKTNYRRYFYKDGGTYVRVSGDSAPPWESNKYYVCNEIP